jgi:hypothetical protein
MVRAKKISLALLSFALMTSLAACSGVNKEDVLKRAETFSKAVANLDSTKMLKSVEKIDSDKADKIADKLSMTKLDYDQVKVKNAIADTIEYKVIEDSFEAGKKDKSATVDVEFSLVDYGMTFTDDGLKTSEEMVSAIKSCKQTKTWLVSLELVQDDDKWVVTEDTLPNLAPVYKFLDEEFKFGNTSSDAILMVDYTKWYMSNNTGIYENVDKIELDLYFTGDLGMDLYYVVSWDGSEVYRSDKFNVPSYFAEAPYGRDQNAYMDGEYLAPGSYTITFYSADDDMIITSNNATVSVKRATPTPTPAPTPDYPVATDYYQVYNTDFANIKELKWYQYDSDKGQLQEEGKGIYYKGVKTLAFAIKIEGEGPELYYAYYYLGEDIDTVDYTKLLTTEPDYSNTVSPRTYDDGNYYDIDYKPDKVKPGYYYVVIASDKSMGFISPYVYAVCEVLDKKAP